MVCFCFVLFCFFLPSLTESDDANEAQLDMHAIKWRRLNRTISIVGTKGKEEARMCNWRTGERYLSPDVIDSLSIKFYWISPKNLPASVEFLGFDSKSCS